MADRFDKPSNGQSRLFRKQWLFTIGGGSLCVGGLLERGWQA
jgi:hypothetical protein